MNGEFTFGFCCDPTLPYNLQSTYCKTQTNMQFCATQTSIKNSDLLGFVCPASTAYCPNKHSDILMYVEEKEKWFYKEYAWSMDMPSEKASDWNCKYHIIAARSLVITPPDQQTRPYMFIEIETYGFDNFVKIIVQEYDKFRDYNPDQPVDSITRVHDVQFGGKNKFVVPGEHDILISFAPVSNDPIREGIVSPNGKFRMRAKLIDNSATLY
jgi:hypothetical protein